LGYNDEGEMVGPRIAVIVIALGVVGLGASAQAETERMSPKAKRHFDQGLRLYNVQSYDEAIAEFRAGYQIDPRPEFLYALAQAQRMNRDCPAAIASYETFLRTGPAARQEAAARAQIEACRAEIAAAADAAAPPPAPAPAPPPPVASEPASAPVPETAERTVAPAPPAEPAAVPAIAKAVVRPADPALSASAERPAPLHRRWWFWALLGAGVVTAFGVAAAAGAFTRTVDATCPAGRDCGP
jgi:tetratricopeptide (TPR) repeat protein